ncbi:UDP-N-acetylmuramoyl-tripeptide--D-alanyl-D-alanine ligase [Actibacterium lipolyticum]|uniref:UDP-N-acetylmuramoyl-tripeptide--D-alanyl-D-alanine ligase n=1 Tax=Actibacterium lipolyticum TaxID=1524263 RepID=A0A238JVK9_9RHOB|nr:UDP-N-acetylmuramoyl-tripeptide--D-alanyl-D-alanine ligase [Actibacterium lipolyticum]SMX33776.1 UDP-N-acetylmuramoyl-tripeptide--D-alanyl-D-alanine ligase [Actibacterium lipolyticum]
MGALWTSAAAEAATGGKSTQAWEANGVSIDTRSIAPGDLFVALKDVRDGHDFVAQALENGAAAALVSRIPEGVPANAPLLVVDDVLPALEALGRAARDRTTAKVVAVTGSVGKTSTKEMLRAVLAGQGTVHAAEKSFNNHWGVPITLARMPQDADFAVIEIGMNHPGEIAPLAQMARPHVAMITTVVAAHLEAFENVAAIAHEKASILDGLEPGGTAVLLNDLDVSPILLAKADQVGAKTLTFGASAGCDFRLTEVTLKADATIAHAAVGGNDLLFKIQTAGRHFAMNALGGLAVADAVGADLAVAACDLVNWAPPAGRGAREKLLLDDIDDRMAFDLIDDAFNANPASMEAALDVLAAAEPEDGIGRVAKGRRIAVLGDMLELGPTEEALHRAIADDPSLRGVSLVHCVGPRMRVLYDVLPRHQRGEWHETAAELAARARSLVDAGDVVLVKGSKGSRVSLVVDALRKLGQAVPND